MDFKLRLILLVWTGAILCFAVCITDIEKGVNIVWPCLLTVNYSHSTVVDPPFSRWAWHHIFLLTFMS